MKVQQPTDASIILTYRCPMQCRMCNIWQYPTDKKEEITAEDLKSLPKLKFINLTGGEPFIREDLPEIVEECYRHAPRIVISTSGWFEDRVIKLAERFPNIGIRISIEGLSGKKMCIRDRVIFPRPLVNGDKIAIVSPASIINPEYVSGAVDVLRRLGWNPYVAPHALDASGSFSGTVSERLADINQALDDPEVRAILCSRGGYGAVHLLDKLDSNAFEKDPKWIIGFSDISALHAYASHHNVASIHSSMCKHLALFGEHDECSRALIGILRGKMPEYNVGPHCYNRHGVASGKVVGGNLAVISALLATPCLLYTSTMVPSNSRKLHVFARKCIGKEMTLWRAIAGKTERQQSLLKGIIDFPIRRIALPLLTMLSRINAGSRLRHTLSAPFHAPRRREDIFPLGKVMFEGHEFPAPGNTDAYLRLIYGDYTKIPPVDKIHVHAKKIEIYDTDV